MFVLRQAKLNGETLPQKNINMVESHRKIHMMLTSSICMHTHRKTDRQKDKHTHMKKKKVKIISVISGIKKYLVAKQQTGRSDYLSPQGRFLEGKLQERYVSGEACVLWHTRGGG